MTAKQKSLLFIGSLAGFIAGSVCGQGTFQNLDFENGTFIPIQGNPFFVEPGPALPGWTAYVGTNLAQHLLHNTLSLGTAEIAIQGPVQPIDSLHGQYYVVLQNPLSVPTDVPALTQTGTIPTSSLSLRFLTADALAVGFTVSFAGQQIPLTYLGQNNQFSYIWGGDISAFAGQMGELRFRGNGYLDFIQFSNQPIPEPSVVWLDHPRRFAPRLAALQGAVVNVAGYFLMGLHRSLGLLGFPVLTFSTNGAVAWTGSSSWYLIQTFESGNGQRNTDFGGFFHWFSPSAFGGTN